MNPIRWKWSDTAAHALLGLLAAAAFMIGLTACDTHDSKPQPVANKAAHATPAPCRDKRVTGSVVQLCADALTVPAYGWTNPDGSTATDPGGKADVRDTLSDTSLSPVEIKAQLQGITADYKAHGGGPKSVTVNLSELPDGGDCWYEVKRDGSVEPLCEPSYGLPADHTK